STQPLRQASVSTRLPSSHCSIPAQANPSPQYGSSQLLGKSSLSTRLSSSHSSTPAHTSPSPQEAATQVLRQASVSSMLPSSHSSPGSTIASPQVSLHAAAHVMGLSSSV